MTMDFIQRYARGEIDRTACLQMQDDPRKRASG
jgi:hypothetical protein